MKIIARKDGGAFVTMSNKELANVMGYSRMDSDLSSSVDRLVAGESEIEISHIYSQHEQLQSLIKEEIIQSARAKLEKVLATLTPIQNKVVMLQEASRKKP